MKLNKLWIPALLLFIVGGCVKICDTLFNVNGTGFILSSTACNLTLAGCVILLYIFGTALSLSDRKKTFKAEPTKNTLCGVFGFIASVALLGGGAIRIIAGENLVESILAILAGFVLLYEACISFTGMNGMKKMPVAALIVPIWCCVRFIVLFIDYTQKSLKATELFDIIAVACLIMFLFYQSMYFAAINNRMAVRKAAVYGTVFVMLDLIVCADLLIKMFIGKQPLPNIDTQVVEPSIQNIVMIIGDLAFCCYAFFFIREILKTADDNLTWPAEQPQDDLLLMDEDEVLAEVPAVSESAEESADVNVQFSPDAESVQEEAAKPEAAPTAAEPTAVKSPEEDKTDINAAVATMEVTAAKADTEGAFPGVTAIHITEGTAAQPPKKDEEAYGELLDMLDKMQDS